MNNKRTDYYPVIGYTFILVAVWLLSWLLDIVAILMDSNFEIQSLVSSTGMRWTMRNALPSLEEVPWGGIMLSLSAYGLLKGAGITSLFSHIIKRENLTKMETRSLLFSIFALLLYLSVLYLITFLHRNILLGVNGTFENSSFVSGLPLLLFFAVLILALVYGFMYGNYRSAIDVVNFMGNTYIIYVPALIALIPAAGIIASVNYIGLFRLLGLTNDETDIIAMIFYLIPFIHIISGKRKN